MTTRDIRVVSSGEPDPFPLSTESILEVLYLPNCESLQRQLRREEKPALPGRGKPLTIAVISDRNFRPHTLGLLHNLAGVANVRLEVHWLELGAEDFPSSSMLPLATRLHGYRLSQLWSSSELSSILHRTRSQQAYSSKARLCLKALGIAQGPVLYLDSDIYFFTSPIALTKELGKRPILLFPHWNDSLPNARLHGLFNAGMFGVAPGAEPFLEWWANLCWAKCSGEAGFFDDQGYLDLAPVFFDSVTVSRDSSHNVAAWNERTLGIFWKDGEPWCRFPVKKRIKSFHAARPDSAGVFEVKAVYDQWTALRFGLLDPAKSPHLFGTILDQQRRHRPELDTILSSVNSLNQKLGVNLIPTSETSLSLLSTRGAKGVLSFYDQLRGMAKRLRRPPVGAEESADWIALQRKYLQ